jgi:hypothetical protein
MTIETDPTRHTTDLESMFSGDKAWVKLCAELLQRSIRDHQPVLDRMEPNCQGCAHLRRAYEDLLAQSVALIERSARAESERTRLNGEFLRSVRHSHPERARQYETNPRVGRPLASLSPELLADLAVNWSELTRVEMADAMTAKLAAAKAAAQAVVDELADKLRAVLAERDQLRELRTAMGLDELGLPSMLTDKLAAGTITLHEFLRQAAGAGGSRSFSVDGREVVVSLGTRARGPSSEATSTPPHPAPGPHDAHPHADAPPEHTVPQQPATSPPVETPWPDATPAAAHTAHTAQPASRSSESDELAVPPPLAAPAAPQGVGHPTLTERPSTDGPPVRPVAQQAPSSQPSPPNRRNVTEDVLRDEAIRTIVCEEAWSERRLERELAAIGLESGAALASLARARLVKFVHTGSDGFIFPTANFHAASEKIVPLEITSASARGWGTVIGSLTAEQDRVAFASVLAPFVSAGWNLLFLNRARDAKVFWLTLRREQSDAASDDVRPRYSTGTLAVLLDPPPYQLPESRRLAEQQVIWLAGAPEHTGAVRGLPSSIDVWRAAPPAGADEDWVPVRSATDHPPR